MYLHCNEACLEVHNKLPDIMNRPRLCFNLDAL